MQPAGRRTMKLTIALEESIYVLLCVKHGFKNGWRDISKEELSANMYCIREINLTAISPQISSSTFCVVMCAWCSSTFCSCAHLPSGAWSGKKRKRTSFCQNNLPSPAFPPLNWTKLCFCSICSTSPRRPAGYFDKVNLSQRTTQKLRRINKEISPGDKHISRLPLERGSLLNKNAYSMVCFSAAMRALLPENASPYLIIDLIPNACISAL